MLRPSVVVDSSFAGAQEIVDLEERSWLPRYCRGDAVAFTQLMVAYRKTVYSYLVRCGLNKETRDDVFQEVFIKIHAAAASYHPSRPLRPWIFTIVANTVRNHFRSDCTRRSVFDHREAPDIPDPVGGTERQVAASELVGHVEQAIARLPFAQREVLVLTTIEGMRQKDVAEILRIPANTVKTHLRRARLALTRSLSATLAVDSGGDHGAL